MTPTPAAGPVLAQRRAIRTPVPGPASTGLGDRARRAVARGVAPAAPVFAARAGGGVLVDVDGNSFIDLASGIAVTSVGASAPRVVRAVAEQVAAFTHTCAMVTPYEGYVAVAEQLNTLTPGDHEKRTALFSTGAEAVENAVKIARAATGRTVVAGLDHAFHGRTNLALALTARHRPYRCGFGPFAPAVRRVPGSYPYRDGLDGPAAARRTIDVLERDVGPEDLAALVVEPVQGEGGVIVPARGFLPALAAWCAAHGVLLVADEIQTGIARTGDWFACEHEGVVPDLVLTAKGLAGGLPLAAVTGRAALVDAPGPGSLGGTFGGNPVACAAALATLDTIRADDLLVRAGRLGAKMTGVLSRVQARDPRVGEVRGRGAMVAAELVDPRTGDPDPALARTVAAAVRQAGVLLLVSGTYGNVLRFLPPLTLGDDLLAEALDLVDLTLQESA